MWRCIRCDEYRYNSTACGCKPFTVIEDDGGEAAVYAMDEEDAALKYAETSNVENEYYLMNESVVITINDKQFEISAEPDVHYSANEI